MVGRVTRYLKSAADILYCMGEKEKADLYYNHLLKSLASNGAMTEDPDDFLDTVLGGHDGGQALHVSCPADLAPDDR